MIKIFNKDLNNEKIVTQGAYREFYEHLGYEIVNEKKGKPIETKEVKKTENKEIEKDKEKPLENYTRK